MGRYVATDADLSLRLVAFAATESDLCKAEPHARGTRRKWQKLSGLLDKKTAQLYASVLPPSDPPAIRIGA